MSDNSYFDADGSYLTEESSIYQGGSEESNWLADEAIKLAVPHLSSYRGETDTILKALGEYLKNNKEILISNKSILTESLDVEYMISLYCNNPFRHANNLTNWLFEKNKNLPYVNTFQMRTIVEKEEFKIDYNTKTIIHIMALAPYNPEKSQWNYTKAILPVEIDNLRYIPPEIELIDLYNQIVVNGESKQLLEVENKLFALTTKRYKLDSIKGSFETTGGKSCQERKRDLLDICKIATVQDWLPKQTSTILVGSWGYNLWKLSRKNLCINQDRVQLFTMTQHKQLTATLQKFINNNINPNLQITHSESRRLNLPKEFRTMRHVYSIVIPDSSGMKEKPFLEIYDMLDHTPVPMFKTEGCLVASKYIMIRFLLIDLWNFSILKSFDKIPVDLYEQKLVRIFKFVQDIRGNFPAPTAIIGRFVDYAIDKSNRNKTLSKQGGRFPPYLPWLELKRSNKLRKI